MLDIRLIRQDPDGVSNALKRRSPELSVDTILVLDQKRIQLLQEEEILRSDRNRLSKEVGQHKSKGENTDALQDETRAIGERIKTIEADKDALALEQENLLAVLPNIPFPEVPEGCDETANVVVRSWG